MVSFGGFEKCRLADEALGFLPLKRDLRPKDAPQVEPESSVDRVVHAIWKVP